MNGNFDNYYAERHTFILRPTPKLHKEYLLIILTFTNTYSLPFLFVLFDSSLHHSHSDTGRLYYLSASE